MQLPTNCPSCNSLQRFAVHERRAAGKIESFASCKMCGYEIVLESHTQAERLRARRDRVHLLRQLRRRVR